MRLSFQIYVHSPFEVMNIAKVKHYATASYEYLCSSNEVAVDENFQK